MARLRAQIAPRPLQYADAVRALRVHADPHKARVSRGFLKGSKHHFCRSFLAEVGAFTPPSTGISSKVTRPQYAKAYSLRWPRSSPTQEKDISPARCRLHRCCRYGPAPGDRGHV